MFVCLYGKPTTSKISGLKGEVWGAVWIVTVLSEQNKGLKRLEEMRYALLYAVLSQKKLVKLNDTSASQKEEMSILKVSLQLF